MNSSNYRFTLDMHSAQSQVSIPVMLGDTGRTLRINLSDGSNPYRITDGCLAKISIKRPTETRLEEFCSIENNTTIVYPFSQNENTCAVEGIHECDVTLYGSDGSIITSPRFTMVVNERVVRSDDIVISDEDQTAIDAMLTAEAARQVAETERLANEKVRQETATQFDSALEKANTAASEAANAAKAAKNAKDSLEKRFAGEVWEDENMNLYSGDCKTNNDYNGDDSVTGKCNALLNSGGGNRITGDHNLVSGALNTVDAENCINIGLGNWNKLREVDGHTYGHRASTFGRYLISSANDQMWTGRWNKEHDGVLFGVGNGTADNKRSNAFVVYSAGTASVGHDPIGDMDVTTKRYVDRAVAPLLGIPTVPMSEYGQHICIGGKIYGDATELILVCPCNYFSTQVGAELKICVCYSDYDTYENEFYDLHVVVTEVFVDHNDFMRFAVRRIAGDLNAALAFITVANRFANTGKELTFDPIEY